MQMSNLIFKRENLVLPINGKEEGWDYLTIYNTKGDVVARSGHAHPEHIIHMKHEGFEIVAPPQSREDEEESIYITIASIKDQIHEKA